MTYEITFYSHDDSSLKINAPQEHEGYPADFIRMIIAFLAIKGEQSAQAAGNHAMEMDCRKIKRIVGFIEAKRRHVQ